jgi:hypothetical protein
MDPEYGICEKGNEKRLEVKQMTFLRPLRSFTSRDHITNYISQLGETSMMEGKNGKVVY